MGSGWASMGWPRPTEMRLRLEGLCKHLLLEERQMVAEAEARSKALAPALAEVGGLRPLCQATKRGPKPRRRPSQPRPALAWMQVLERH